jgi:CRISPR-associated protein Cas2
MSREPGLWVLVYDIAEDARRRRVHALLKQFGDPVQGSAFEARLTPAELRMLVDRATRLIDAQEDKLYAYPVSGVREADIVVVGRARPAIRRRTFWIV